jgi:hypothetical protein
MQSSSWLLAGGMGRLIRHLHAPEDVIALRVSWARCSQLCTHCDHLLQPGSGCIPGGRGSHHQQRHNLHSRHAIGMPVASQPQCQLSRQAGA